MKGMSLLRNILLDFTTCSDGSIQSGYKGKPASAVADDGKERGHVPGSTNVAENFPHAARDDRHNRLLELVPVVRRMWSSALSRDRSVMIKYCTTHIIASEV